jgi:hypothetical protein
VGIKADNHEFAAGYQNPGRLSQHAARLRREIHSVMKNEDIDTGIGKGKFVHLTTDLARWTHRKPMADKTVTRQPDRTGRTDLYEVITETSGNDLLTYPLFLRQDVAAQRTGKPVIKSLSKNGRAQGVGIIKQAWQTHQTQPPVIW